VGKAVVQRLVPGGMISALKHKPQRHRRASKQRGERMRPAEAKRVWGLDFVADQFADGRRFRALTIVDVCTREKPGD